MPGIKPKTVHMLGKASTTEAPDERVSIHLLLHSCMCVMCEHLHMHAMMHVLSSEINPGHVPLPITLRQPLSLLPTVYQATSATLHKLLESLLSLPPTSGGAGQHTHMHYSIQVCLLYLCTHAHLSMCTYILREQLARVCSLLPPRAT